MPTTTAGPRGSLTDEGETSASEDDVGSSPISDLRATTAHAALTAMTASVMTARSGRYIRRSAPTSVAIGTMLDVGASVTKNQAPRKPTLGHRLNATRVAISSTPMNERMGPHVAERQRQRPAVEHDQRSRPDRETQVVRDHHASGSADRSTAESRPKIRRLPRAGPTSQRREHAATSPRGRGRDASWPGTPA